ncbi:N-acetyltransferase [Agromyces rhizosphaerae]|uniref:N-acetyltransferase n=1 Tax=Agromyces rhizosphaerae TaxID=88374 RepID=A0A9W6CVN1_9MICO|nr:GNAT family N-acetyltransferase [Agromyces rhizosphaerae]GLI27634.1 N-acetyltransferase [Agromyces rhizosphaerae]
MVTITAVTPADRDEWGRLWAGYLEFYETDLDEATTDATFAALLDPTSTVHGALARDEAGRAIGLVHWLTHAATWSTADYCYLEDLFVAPDARVGGAGRALIAHVHEWAAGHGCAKVYWLTAETNQVARGLYDRVASRSGFIHYQISL